MCCIFVPEGIIMAADSRLTRTRTSAPVELPAEEGIRKYRVDRTTYTLSDNAQKSISTKQIKSWYILLR